MDGQQPAAALAFALVRRGYERRQVDEELGRVAAEVQILRADRDSAVARAERAATALGQARSEHERLTGRVAELESGGISAGDVPERLRAQVERSTQEADRIRRDAAEAAETALVEARDEAWRVRSAATAESEAALALATTESEKLLRTAGGRATEILADAKREAERALSDARTDAGKLTSAARSESAALLEAAAAQRAETARTLTDMRARAEALRSERDGVLDSAHRTAGEVTARAEAHRRLLDDQARRRREAVDEDHRIASDRRRSAAVAEAEQVRQAAARHAAHVRAETEAACAARERAAAEEVRRLTAERDAIAGDLAAIRARLEFLPELSSSAGSRPAAPGPTSTPNASADASPGRPRATPPHAPHPGR